MERLGGVDSESLPLLGVADEARPRGDAEPVARAEAFARIERRIERGLRGSGVIVVHDLHVPATATAIDHLCIGENAITAIDVERAPGGDGRAALVGRLMRETEILAAVLGPVGVDAERIRGGVCRLGRLPVPRSGRSGAIAVCDARGAAKLARRAAEGRRIDVQTVLAVVRHKLGHEGQRSHRITRPDGF